MRLKSSDGECIINSMGGVGTFGTFGDITKAKVEKGVWKRVVISVKCASSGDKGTLSTWVDTEQGVVLQDDSITADDRFAIDPASFFLFSSAKAAMMPGKIAIRMVRVDTVAMADADVKRMRARDKVISIFNEQQQAQVDEQRRGLSLAPLFAKPRPIWSAPALQGTFGDAYIEHTGFEGQGALAWSYAVLNFALQRTLQQPLLSVGLTASQRGVVADVLHVFKRSEPIFKLMLKLQLHPNDSQLLSFLRKLGKHLDNLRVGEALLLPAMVGGGDMLLLVEKSTEREFTFVVVQTDPQGGLQYHNASPTVAPPLIMFRSCMVLEGIPKKHALDDVFWLALYRMTLYPDRNGTDIARFYDILIPFLTGKPLQTSLVEVEEQAQKMAREALRGDLSSSAGSSGASGSVAGTIPRPPPTSRASSPPRRSVAAQNRKLFGRSGGGGGGGGGGGASSSGGGGGSAAEDESPQAANDTTATIGDWRSPQRSDTSYVRCVLEALRYLLRRRGLSPARSTQVTLSLQTELADMILNDLRYMHPDVNGQKVCEMVVQELSSSAVGFAQELEQELDLQEDGAATVAGSATATTDEDAGEGAGGASFVEESVERVLQLVDELNAALDSCADEEVELPSVLALGGPEEREVWAEKRAKARAEGSGSGGVAAAAEAGTDAASAAPPAVSGDDPSLMQFEDMLGWDVEINDPDPGQAVTLRKYVPVDMLQVPVKVATREEAVEAIRQCDRLCTLLDHQPHCVKNDKYLIAALIEHVFTHVVPVPKPRAQSYNNDKAEHRAGRMERKRLKQKQKRQEERRMKKEKRKAAKAARLKRKLAGIMSKKDDGDEGEGGASDQAGIAAEAEDKKVDLDSDDDSDDDSEDDEDDDDASDDGVDGDDDDDSEEDGAGKKGKRKSSDVDDDEDELRKMKRNKKKKRRKKKGKNNEKVECFGELEETDFAVGLEAEKTVNAEPCLWDGTIEYELQLELLIALQRLIEHFAAAAASIQQSRQFDGVCIVVPGVIAAISDAIMRKRATNHPSTVCCHLMGMTVEGKQLGVRGFGLSVGTFGTQSETIEVHSPELCVARTAVLDYFQSPAQQPLEKIFTWEKCFELKPGRPLVSFLRMIQREIALPISRPYTQLLCNLPTVSELMKNFPELCCYRDIAFWWKYFLNPDITAFRNYSNPEEPKLLSRFSRMGAQLVWSWADQEGGYAVSALEAGLRCRPAPRKKGDPIPKHRYPSVATASFYVEPPRIRTEDDVIYRPNLPSFQTDERPELGQMLGQRDSELLLSFLTAPYLRLPVVLTFFATDDRVHKLISPELRDILDSVLFEPGRYLFVNLGGVEPIMVPTQHPQLLASAYGALLNELHRSPTTVIRGVIQLLQGGLALDTGTVVDEGEEDFNGSADIILYVARLGARVENYASFLVEHSTDTHQCIGADRKLREVEVEADCLAQLKRGLAELQGLLQGSFNSLLEDYLRKLDRQTSDDPSNEALIDRNSRLASDLHAHKLLMFRNVRLEEMRPAVVKAIVGSFVFMTTRHTWNKADRVAGRLLIPETQLYEVLQVQRRRLITWTNSLPQRGLDGVMQTGLQLSTSTTGSLVRAAKEVDPMNRWGKIGGVHSVGRFAIASVRVGGTSAVTGAIGADKEGEGEAPATAQATAQVPHISNQTS
jgi:uncharacterized membrane protein YgcG